MPGSSLAGSGFKHVVSVQSGIFVIAPNADGAVRAHGALWGTF
ncbi:MAG: hypothetical protein JWQ66_856 [Mucilaginibacter sp.]|nr:hypothetical protein [Mucilaginibacter sp.]